jgi:hypothetical protein
MEVGEGEVCRGRRLHERDEERSDGVKGGRRGEVGGKVKER